MSTTLRVECPVCGTSFKLPENTKTGDADKVVIPCMCGRILEATFENLPQGRTWYGAKRPTEKVVKVSASASGG